MIVRPSPASEFFTDERCYIIELSNSSDDEGLSIARARVAPGVTTRWHRLRGTEERYLILEGEGLMETGALAPTKVTAGDVVLIPAQCRQRITNTGKTDLVFLAHCTPRFRPENYENVEEALPAQT